MNVIKSIDCIENSADTDWIYISLLSFDVENN